MKAIFDVRVCKFIGVCLIVFLAGRVSADGMLPETTVIILNEEDGEASLNVSNSDPIPALLYSSVQNVPEDPEFLVIVTPPVTRVDAGEKQLVRLISQLSEPLKTQRLKRVTFEGIPQEKDDTIASVGVTIRQNLPLILHPRGLAKNPSPWTLLTWSRSATHLIIRNDSSYVVRLAQEVLLNPGKTLVDIARTYVLPGERLAIRVNAELANATSVTFYPATVYGFTVASHDAQVAVETP